MEASLKQKITLPTLMIWADGDEALGEELLEGMDRYVDSFLFQSIHPPTHPPTTQSHSI